MRLLNSVRRIAAHACRWAELPTITVPVRDTRDDEQREFDHDLEYLRDLADAEMAELKEAAEEWVAAVEPGTIPLPLMHHLLRAQWLERLPIENDLWETLP